MKNTSLTIHFPDGNSFEVKIDVKNALNEISKIRKLLTERNWCWIPIVTSDPKEMAEIFIPAEMTNQVYLKAVNFH